MFLLHLCQHDAFEEDSQEEYDPLDAVGSLFLACWEETLSQSPGPGGGGSYRLPCLCDPDTVKRDDIRAGVSPHLRAPQCPLRYLQPPLKRSTEHKHRLIIRPLRL